MTTSVSESISPGTPIRSLTLAATFFPRSDERERVDLPRHADPLAHARGYFAPVTAGGGESIRSLTLAAA